MKKKHKDMLQVLIRDDFDNNSPGSQITNYYMCDELIELSIALKLETDFIKQLISDEKL